MKRRDLITLLVGAVGWPLVARAQQGKVPVVGVLLPGNADPEIFLKGFREALRDAGYIDGQTIRLEVRSGEGRASLLPEKAAELVRLKVDLIVTSQTPAVLAAKQATRDIPIVMASAGDPVATGVDRQPGPPRRKRDRPVGRERGARGQEPRADPRGDSVRAPRRGSGQRGRSLHASAASTNQPGGACTRLRDCAGDDPACGAARSGLRGDEQQACRCPRRPGNPPEQGTVRARDQAPLAVVRGQPTGGPVGRADDAIPRAMRKYTARQRGTSTRSSRAASRLTCLSRSPPSSSW